MTPQFGLEVKWGKENLIKKNKIKLVPPRDILLRVYSVPCDSVRKQFLQNTVVFACISFPLYPLSGQ